MRWRIAAIGALALCAPWAVLAAGHPETADDWIETLLVNWGPIISGSTWSASRRSWSE
jgi:hypothetical protein